MALTKMTLYSSVSVLGPQSAVVTFRETEVSQGPFHPRSPRAGRLPPAEGTCACLRGSSSSSSGLSLKLLVFLC